jgi:hypothetical protein
MPIFFHVILWGLGILILIFGIITVIGFWVVEVEDDRLTDWLKEKGAADPSNVLAKDRWYGKHPDLTALAILIGVTLGWVILLALFVQIVTIAYGS